MHTEDLIDPIDGENRAVRSFLLLYSGTPGLTFGTMKKHMNMSGYPYWPDWVNGLEGEHLNKLGAQNWLRHLFSLESITNKQSTEKTEEYLKVGTVYKGWVSPEGFQIVYDDECCEIPEGITNIYIRKLK